MANTQFSIFFFSLWCILDFLANTNPALETDYDQETLTCLYFSILYDIKFKHWSSSPLFPHLYIWSSSPVHVATPSIIIIPPPHLHSPFLTFKPLPLLPITPYRFSTNTCRNICLLYLSWESHMDSHLDGLLPVWPWNLEHSIRRLALEGTRTRQLIQGLRAGFLPP